MLGLYLVSWIIYSVGNFRSDDLTFKMSINVKYQACNTSVTINPVVNMYGKEENCHISASET